jgi:MFS family permease
LQSATKKTSALSAITVVTFTYLVAVVQRSSLGVAALEASTRFEVNAATLSTLAVLQLATYTIMQIPSGIFLDRFGTKASLMMGTLVMSTGQLVVALVPIFGLAVAGRVLVGFGDAFIFISLVRSVNIWFGGKSAGRTQQIVANIGQLGQIFSAIPFHFVLIKLGWTPAFGMLSTLALVAALLVWAVLSESRFETAPRTLLQAAEVLRENVAHPATRIGFWTHFSLQSSGSSFILLWGYPFLVKGQDLSPAIATGMLSSFVFIGFVFGPFVSGLATKFPTRRSDIVLTLGLIISAAWVAVCLSTKPLPFLALLLFVLAIGIGGPASMLAFDFSRRFIEPGRQGSANGFINMGGFVAAFTLMFLVGLGLDLAVAIGVAPVQYSLEAFRMAFIVEPLVTIFGLCMVAYERKNLRQKVFVDEGIIIRPVRVVLGERLGSRK